MLLSLLKYQMCWFGLFNSDSDWPIWVTRENNTSDIIYWGRKWNIGIQRKKNGGRRREKGWKPPYPVDTIYHPHFCFEELSGTVYACSSRAFLSSACVSRNSRLPAQSKQLIWLGSCEAKIGEDTWYWIRGTVLIPGDCSVYCKLWRFFSG